VVEPVAGLFCSWHRTCADTVALPLPYNGQQWRWLTLPLDFTMTTQISQIADALYAPRPFGHLFHYTGYDALLSISRTKELWASEMHYFNDSSELKHAGEIFLSALYNVSHSGKYPSDLLSQLRSWLPDRLSSGNQIFVTCFSLNGDLLSQWRGYTPHGKGLSLGFNASRIADLARLQGYSLGECIYVPEKQMEIAELVLHSLLSVVEAHGPENSPGWPSAKSYFPAFARSEFDLMRVAALIKHPAFLEESEWRVVSVVPEISASHSISFRAGKTTLIPYLPFKIIQEQQSLIHLDRVHLGPTAENNLAMSALSQFFRSQGFHIEQGIYASQVPFRET
jgi:hypothetical protein